MNQKSRFGDLEMNLVMGKDHKGTLLTINDKATGMLKIVKIDSREAQVIETAVIIFLEAISSQKVQLLSHHI